MSAENLAELIQRAQARDEAAFDALVDQYSARLYGYLYRLTGSRADAEDLLQEVFVRLVRTIDRYVDDGRFDAWIFRIATNLVRDRVRRAKRRPIMMTGEPDDAILADMPDQATAADPTRAPELAEVSDRLQTAIAQLGPAEREVIMLRHFAELSFKEIAEMTGTPLGTALARAHRGLKKLRNLLEAAENDRANECPQTWNGLDTGPATAGG